MYTIIYPFKNIFMLIFLKSLYIYTILSTTEKYNLYTIKTNINTYYI